MVAATKINNDFRSLSSDNETEKIHQIFESNEEDQKQSEFLLNNSTSGYFAAAKTINDQDLGDFQPREEDLIEAADFGVQAMNDLYAIKEPKLYSMGKFK